MDSLKKSSVTRYAARGISAHNGPFSTSQDCGPRVGIGRYDASLIGTTPRVIRYYYCSISWAVGVGLGRISCLWCVHRRPTYFAFFASKTTVSLVADHCCFWKERPPEGQNRYQMAFICLWVAIGMLGSAQLRSLFVLLPTGKTPCFY